MGALQIQKSRSRKATTHTWGTETTHPASQFHITGWQRLQRATSPNTTSFREWMGKITRREWDFLSNEMPGTPCTSSSD